MLIHSLAEVASRERMCVSLLLVDDGSVDDTWTVVKGASTSSEEGLEIRGVRLEENSGKALAQAIGLRYCHPDSIVVFMDADGQHPVSDLPSLVETCIEVNAAVIATRVGYSRSLVSAVGIRGLKFFMWVLGSDFDPALSEYLAVPAREAGALSRSPQLGITPLLPLVQAVSPNHVTQSVHVLPRVTPGDKTRWALSDLWKKSLLQLLADPWRLLPRMTLTAVIGFFVLLTMVSIAAVHAVIQGTSPGTVAILASVVVLAGLMVGMWIASIVVSVITLRLVSARSTPSQGDDLVHVTEFVDP